MHEPAANRYRDRWCGDLRASDAGSEVRVAGWVHRRRDHGGLIFIDLRDRSGILQLVFHPDSAPAAHAAAHELRGEAVISAAGTILRRDEGNVNPDLPTYPGEPFPNPHASPPLLSDRKLYTEDIVPRSLHLYQDSRELGTGGEIHQLPTNDNREGNYLALASHIEAERRAANTPQIDGRSIVYELQGSDPTPSEMDDEWSRQGRSPRVPTRTWTTVSSRSTSPYPGSPFL